MHDKLTSFFTIIYDQSVPILKFFLFCYFCSYKNQFTQNRLMPLFSMLYHIKSIFNFRNYQDMDGCLWRNISKSNNLSILVYNICWDLFSNNFVKDSFVAHSLLLKRYFIIKRIRFQTIFIYVF